MTFKWALIAHKFRCGMCSRKKINSTFSAKDYSKMGKFIGYTLLVVTIVLVLEWFHVVDVPYLEIPDYTSGKNSMIESKRNALGQTE